MRIECEHDVPNVNSYRRALVNKLQKEWERKAIQVRVRKQVVKQ